VFEQEDVIGLDGSIVLVGDAAHSILVGHPIDISETLVNNF
jgi:hypothetical protein